MKGWFFIPDISGFTSWVHDTELKHSKHILEELLELMIDSITLDLELAEIEGDALLYYSLGSPPSPDLIYEQTAVMYRRFHKYLDHYARRRICPCGACRSAQHLSLKVVAHAGEIEILQLRGHKKPHGAAVIAAHRLLKNSIDNDEYLLITDSLIDSVESRWIASSDSYDYGLQHYYYRLLAPLKEDLTRTAVPVLSYGGEPVVKLQKVIQADLQTAADYLLDLDLRSQWNPAVDAVSYPEGEINQSGSRHVCYVNGSELVLETLGNQPPDTDTLIFGERSTDVHGIDEFAQFWFLEQSGSELRIELSTFIKLSGWRKLLKPIIKKGITRQIQTLMDSYAQAVLGHTGM